ncbi:sugar lactone lactonase YvrE [Marmoricola sp. OAE513]|uniref:SMP-30/gluconolactonase/LRE family protein n=1 Tax=Marmoricola sp. OAE513 TaxID=2817894 RepID=UPI001AEAB78C
MRRVLAAAVATVLGVVVLSAHPQSASSAARAKWNTQVFSRVPYPGTPAYVFAHPNGRVYAGTYASTSNKTASRVFEWTGSGTLLRSWTVPGQKLGQEPGVQVATSDARGRLVLLEKSTSGVLTLNTKTGKFKRQATLPDLPLCSKKKKPCSPNGSDDKAIPNYAAWGPDGALYITDYGQAVIWRIPAKGGAPTVWFASAALDNSLGFGTTGLVYQASTRSFLIGQQTTVDGQALRGRLYRLPVKKGGKPGALSTLWKSRTMELPDGFGIGKSGKIYLANVVSNQIVVLSPAGKELERFPKGVGAGKNGSSIPFDGPSNATFIGKRLLVASQSPVAGDRNHHVIHDVQVGEQGVPTYRRKISRLR